MEEPNNIQKDWTDITLGELVNGLKIRARTLFMNFMATVNSSSFTKNLDPICNSFRGIRILYNSIVRYLV